MFRLVLVFCGAKHQSVVKRVKMAKNAHQVPGSVIERTWCD
jgi:hypothetical protein